MDEVIAIGVVPDEVLLQCGRPDGVPSGWWTPSLAARSAAEVDRRVAAAAEALVADGALERPGGTLQGPLGVVAGLVAATTLVLLVEVERPDGSVERRSVLAAGPAALLDRQDEARGVHDLTVVSARVACELLAGLLTVAPPAVAPLADAVGRHTPAEVAALLPPHRRTATLRLVRTIVGAEVRLLTVVAGATGALVCWATDDGDLAVHPILDEADLADLACLLLGAGPAPAEVAA